MNDCPTRQQLACLLVEQLDEADGAAVEAHVEDCAACREALAALAEESAAGGPTVAVPAPPPADGPSPDFLLRLKQRGPLPEGWAAGWSAPTAEPAPPQTRLPDVPGYEVLGELGRGGMGVVYQARHLDLKRLVALKMLPAHGSTADGRRRFRHEALAMARLHHPHIVQIYDVGETEAGPYFALELVESGSLARLLDGTPWPPADAAAFVEPLAAAVHYAHQQGIIHRDLKPANVLIQRGAGPLTPKLTDFGLAKSADDGSGHTPAGTILGTPSYLAPEQAAMQAVGPAADVYGLGAVLYELLTGRPPFRGGCVMSTLIQVTHEEPVPPRSLSAAVPRDLETICLKCLEKEPAQRYASADALADDLRRFRAGQPVLARPLGWVRRAARWGRRRPSLVAAVAVALVASLVAGYLVYRGQVAASERRAEQCRAAMEKSQLAAMGGDFETAEGAIADAELLGADPTQLALLRGQLAYYSGRTADARDQFERAVGLQPEGVAAHALLALTYADDNRWGDFQRELETARRLPAVAADDFLFLGLAESVYDPDRGLKYLDEALSRRPSVIARLVRSEVLMSLAMDRFDAEAAERGARDADVAKQLLPDNPQALRLSVLARLVAAHVYAATGRRPQCDAALAAARPDAVALGRFPEQRAAVEARWEFFHRIGEEESLRRELTRSPNLIHAQFLYRGGEYSAARAVLEKMPLSFQQEGTLALVLCELPGGRDKALQLYRDGMRNETAEPWDQLTRQMIALVLGLSRESRAACRAFSAERAGLVRRAEYLRALRYLSGEMSEEEYLRAAGESRVDQCNAHFFIGLTRLAQGDRIGARGHFRAAVATGTFLFVHHTLSEMLLARMERDAAWPTWLPGKR